MVKNFHIIFLFCINISIVACNDSPKNLSRPDGYDDQQNPNNRRGGGGESDAERL